MAKSAQSTPVFSKFSALNEPIVGVFYLFLRHYLRTIKKNKNMGLSKEEFKVLVMLYVANSDGRVSLDEVHAMLERTSPKVYAEMKIRFAKMNDVEVLQCIEEHKNRYLTTDADRQELLSDLKAVVEADGKLLPVEEYLLLGVEEVI